MSPEVMREGARIDLRGVEPVRWELVANEMAVDSVVRNSERPLPGEELVVNDVAGPDDPLLLAGHVRSEHAVADKGAFAVPPHADAGVLNSIVDRELAM